jgi:hypothetical protein
MKCDKAQEFFSDYIESTLDQPMVVALETHLNGCQVCSADVADLRSMWTVLDKVPQVEPPADFVWRTTTRLQNEVLNRREAERAKPLPWWKRMTPAQAFSYVGVAALLVIGVAFPVTNKLNSGTWGIGWPFGPHALVNVPPPASQVTPPQFTVQAPGPEGAAALVTITATSAVPGGGAAMGYLVTTPDGALRGPVRRFDQPSNWSPGHSEQVAVQSGGAHAALFRVFNGGNVIAEKTLILPGAAPLSGPLQYVDPYVALQQVANRTGKAMLVDSGLTTPVTLDLQGAAPEQALQSVLSQIGARSVPEASGVIDITR